MRRNRDLLFEVPAIARGDDGDDGRLLGDGQVERAVAADVGRGVVIVAIVVIVVDRLASDLQAHAADRAARPARIADRAADVGACFERHVHPIGRRFHAGDVQLPDRLPVKAKVVAAARDEAHDHEGAVFYRGDARLISATGARHVDSDVGVVGRGDPLPGSWRRRRAGFRRRCRPRAQHLGDDADQLAAVATNV